jgi:hypothetical protein
MLMTERDDTSIANMKFILYCFEWLSGFKINYHISETYIFGMEEDYKVRVANMQNYQLGELPIKCLGIPLSNSTLGREALAA